MQQQSLLPLGRTRSYFFFPEKENHRIQDIRVHPKSIGSEIKPGNLVDKYYEKTRNTRTLPTELAKGYFWMIGDLKETGNKPTLTSPELIPAETAQYFPSLLAHVKTLAGERVELPAYFLRKNRSEDEHAQCTLVAISCRDHGYVHTQTWVKPFKEAFRGNHRVEAQHLHLTEGWFSSNVLGGIISRLVKNNTPVEDHDTTLICLRKELEDFRDVLRIHNVMAGYVFLLDGLGRVRFAASGEATQEEIDQLLQFAKDLIPQPQWRKRRDRNRRR